ncbi:flagellar hook protein FlgE [Sphingomonas jatrophae]|uniref:Flagellar hook protein FlgE n=1 Tax=Sphingomonas jatrophae TaxID=1166337 RepID=A0A1I6MAR3_9SPHN|nr:flagellar hook protein FlgE [Sphingomonas jatrophae]SFS12795.1 flagellar hook protein FlgE [Sphingomonas jatrophae]
MSFYTSLSGLKGAQTDLSTISNNVANVGTIGFKKSRTEFGDIFSASPFQSGSIPGQGTRLKGITQEFGQGGFQTSDRSLDLAISGQGFFVTRSDATGGNVAFTRNGAFGLDAQRYVTDGDGNYLQVLPVDDTGNVTATGLAATRNLQVPATSGEAQATGKVNLSVTFPADADLPSKRAAYASTPYAFDRFDPNSYNYSTATTVYDATGNALPATLYYTRTAAPDAGNAGSTWEARLFVGSSEVGTPTLLSFDANGKLTQPNGPVTFPATQPAGATAPLTLNLDFGTATSQAASPFTLKAFTQDGFAAGQLDNVSVGGDGLVTATFSNGTTQKLGKLAMATFANPSGLRQLGDARWGITGNSGEPLVGEAGSDGLGVIQSGALEQANVDITEELVALIQAQRNFQANAKAIDTANQMTQIAVNLRGS